MEPLILSLSKDAIDRMWPFSVKAKLVRALDSLAFYNDKGISYARHSPPQVQSERSARLTKIRYIVDQIEASALPPGFLLALNSGELATDLTGQYAVAVRANFKTRRQV